MTPGKLLLTAQALMVCAIPLAAQAVTDPLNRFVTGLDQKDFEVVENGASRSIEGFLDMDSPMALAIVSESPLAEASKFNRADETHSHSYETQVNLFIHSSI